MYYNPPTASPAITHKLSHHDSPWGRAHHPGVVPPQPNGYAIYNGAGMQHHPGAHPHAMPSHPAMQHHHHHQNSLSHPYPSPPNGHNGHQSHGLAQGSPTGSGGQVMTQHWQQQLLKYDVRLCSSLSDKLLTDAVAAGPCVEISVPPSATKCFGGAADHEVRRYYHKPESGEGSGRWDGEWLRGGRRDT